MCCSLALSPPTSDLLVAVQRPAISRFFDEGRQADQEFSKSRVRRDAFQRGEAVNSDSVWLKFIDQALNREQMVRQPLRFRIKANNLQFSLIFQRSKSTPQPLALRNSCPRLSS